MADGIYISMAGASARSAQLDAVADNLANAQTPGFKADRPLFSTVLAEQNGTAAFAVATDSGADLMPGPAIATGNQLDVLPENGAFLAVESPGGAIAYTRDGRLSLDVDRTLRAAGLPVLGVNGNQISVPRDAQLQISPSGQVLADGHEIDRLATFQIDGDAQRLGPSVLVPGANGAAVPVDAKMQVGSVEGSNRSAIDSAVELISAQRSFDSSMQAIETYKHLGDSSNELGRVR